MRFRPFFNPRLLLALSALLATACGSSTDKTGLLIAQTACNGKDAQILVGDGFLQSLCGCAEPSGTYSRQGQLFQCTVPSGVVVFFHFQGTMLQHQILSIGSPSFINSPVSDPRPSGNASPASVVREHAIVTSAPGTYRFVDAFNAGMTGELVVQ